jgi:hypothetical protein
MYFFIPKLYLQIGLYSLYLNQTIGFTAVNEYERISVLQDAMLGKFYVHNLYIFLRINFLYTPKPPSDSEPKFEVHLSFPSHPYTLHSIIHLLRGM